MRLFNLVLNSLLDVFILKSIQKPEIDVLPIFGKSTEIEIATFGDLLPRCILLTKFSWIHVHIIEGVDDFMNFRDDHKFNVG